MSVINKFMRAVIKALSYPEIDIKKNYKIERFLTKAATPPIKSLYKMNDQKISLNGREIPIRIFEPEKRLSNEILLFFHGGGWVSGDIDSYTRPCSALSKKTGRRVFSIDYRLAPEHPFPAGLLDCYTAASELINKSSKFDAKPDEIVLIGDSAGGNLAAAVSLMARDKQEFKVNRQILIYPSTYNDHSLSSPFASIKKYGTDYLLTYKKICDYIDLYIQDKSDFTNPYFAPILSNDLSNQPNTLIITAEFDPLRDEGEAYGRKLRAFGSNVKISRLADGLHGFFTLPSSFSHVKSCYKLINNFLSKGDGFER